MLTLKQAMQQTLTIADTITPADSDHNRRWAAYKRQVSAINRELAEMTRDEVTGWVRAELDKARQAPAGNAVFIAILDDWLHLLEMDRNPIKDPAHNQQLPQVVRYRNLSKKWGWSVGYYDGHSLPPQLAEPWAAKLPPAVDLAGLAHPLGLETIRDDDDRKRTIYLTKLNALDQTVRASTPDERRAWLDRELEVARQTSKNGHLRELFEDWSEFIDHGPRRGELAIKRGWSGWDGTGLPPELFRPWDGWQLPISMEE